MSRVALTTQTTQWRRHRKQQPQQTHLPYRRKIGGGRIQNVRNIKQSAAPYPIGASFIFLRLLKGEPKSFA